LAHENTIRSITNNKQGGSEGENEREEGERAREGEMGLGGGGLFLVEPRSTAKLITNRLSVDQHTLTHTRARPYM
jgi:hypothetical protein